MVETTAGIRLVTETEVRVRIKNTAMFFCSEMQLRIHGLDILLSKVNNRLTLWHVQLHPTLSWGYD